MKRLMLAAMLLAAPLLAQPNSTERSTKLVSLKYIDPRSIQNMVNMYGVQTIADSNTKMMSLTGNAASIAAAEAAIKQLDVAQKNLELMVYFVIAGDPANAQQMAGAPPAPAEIRDVVTQLKGAFQYKEYRMLDVLVLRTRAGAEAETTGLMNAGSPPKLTQFSIRNATIGEDGTIRIDRMHAGLRIPFQKEPGKMDYLNTGIDQSIDVKEGQKVVVGRSSLDGPEKALFLILTARIIQ